MRNNAVKIAKYTYLDTDIRYGKQIDSILQTTNKKPFKRIIWVYLLFLVSIAAVFYALAKFSDGGLDLFLDKLINRVDRKSVV